ncbi:MAG: hypothetical protein EPO65_10290 [Dehalococcoidia bacterium]|nr:MAG: hypothetical protein EPO65_10290 [Dehalococcoidia bacterium]
MLFAIVLGIMLGAAAVTLIREYIEGSTDGARDIVLAPAQFPRLAPPAIVTRGGTIRRRAA